MTFTHTWVGLTRSTARLLAAGPPAQEGRELRGRELDETLAARDAVVGGLRGLTGVLVGASRPAGSLSAAAIVTDPAHALHHGLCGLPRAGAGSLAPSEALAHGRGDWATAGRAATALEAHHEQVRGLAGPSAWALLRNVADVAAALPYLDADLSMRLPRSGAQAREALQDPEAHRLLRLAAEELRYRLPSTESGQHHHDLVREHARAMLLRSPGDLPQGLRQLANVLKDVGQDIAAVDVRSVARVLAETTEAAAAAGALWPATAADALSGLRGAGIGSMATLSAPDPRVRILTTEAHLQLTRVTAVDARATLHACVPELCEVSEALSAAVQAAGRTGRLLGRPDENAPSARSHLLWVPTSERKLQQLPAVTALAAASRALATTPEEHGAEREPAGRGVVVERAARAAAGAGSELRALLATRRGTSHAEARPHLPPHPAHRQPHQNPARHLQP